MPQETVENSVPEFVKRDELRGFCDVDKQAMAKWLGAGADNYKEATASFLLSALEQGWQDPTSSNFKLSRQNALIMACLVSKQGHWTDGKPDGDDGAAIRKQLRDKLTEEMGGPEKAKVVYSEGYTQDEGDPPSMTNPSAVVTPLSGKVEEIVDDWFKTDSMQARLNEETSNYETAERLFNEELNRAKTLAQENLGLKAEVDRLQSEASKAKEVEAPWDDEAREQARAVYDKLTGNPTKGTASKRRVEQVIETADSVEINEQADDESGWKEADEKLVELFGHLPAMNQVYQEADNQALKGVVARGEEDYSDESTNVARVAAVQSYLRAEGLVEGNEGQVAGQVVNLINSLNPSLIRKIEGVGTRTQLIARMPGVLRLRLEERREEARTRIEANKERAEVEKYFEDTKLVALPSSDAGGQRIDSEWQARLTEAEGLGLEVDLGTVSCDLQSEIAPEAVIGLGFDQMEFPEVNLTESPDQTKMVLDGNLIIQARIPGWQYEAGADEGLLIQENKVVARVTVEDNRVVVTREEGVEAGLWLDGVVALGESFSRIVDQEPGVISRLMLRSESQISLGDRILANLDEKEAIVEANLLDGNKVIGRIEAVKADEQKSGQRLNQDLQTRISQGLPAFLEIGLAVPEKLSQLEGSVLELTSDGNPRLFIKLPLDEAKAALETIENGPQVEQRDGLTEERAYKAVDVGGSRMNVYAFRVQGEDSVYIQMNPDSFRVTEAVTEINNFLLNVESFLPTILDQQDVELHLEWSRGGGEYQFKPDDGDKDLWVLEIPMDEASDYGKVKREVRDATEVAVRSTEYQKGTTRLSLKIGDYGLSHVYLTAFTAETSEEFAARILKIESERGALVKERYSQERDFKDAYNGLSRRWQRVGWQFPADGAGKAWRWYEAEMNKGEWGFEPSDDQSVWRVDFKAGEAADFEEFKERAKKAHLKASAAGYDSHSQELKITINGKDFLSTDDLASLDVSKSPEDFIRLTIQNDKDELTQSEFEELAQERAELVERNMGWEVSEEKAKAEWGNYSKKKVEDASPGQEVVDITGSVSSFKDLKAIAEAGTKQVKNDGKVVLTEEDLEDLSSSSDIGEYIRRQLKSEEIGDQETFVSRYRDFANWFEFTVNCKIDPDIAGEEWEKYKGGDEEAQVEQESAEPVKDEKPDDVWDAAFSGEIDEKKPDGALDF